MKTIVLGFVACSLVFAQAPTKAPAAKSTATGAPAKAATKSTVAKGPVRPPDSGMTPALAKAKAPDVYKAVFTTTKGDFTIEVHRDWAPIGADRFYNLVKN